MPKAGVERDVFLGKRYGPEGLASATAYLKRLGEAEGIKFSLKAKIVNSHDAHRLVQLGKTKSTEVENRVISMLFKKYFEEDADIASHSVLAAIGEQVGLDGAEVKDWLSQGQGGREVDREVEEASRKGIHGVPNFTINGRYQLEGAQDVRKFLEVFVRAREAAPDVSAGSADAPSC